MVDIADTRLRSTREPSTAEPSTAELSTAELVRRASEQMSRLVRDELTLARAEMAVKGKRAGVGAGLLGGAGLIGLYGVAALAATAVLALDLVLPAWLAALIVAALLLITAGVLALVGRSGVRRATPPVPVEAMHSVQADIDEVRRRVRR